MTIEEILMRLRVQKHAGRGRDNRCICPVHDDKTGSLMIKVDDSTGRILMCCQAGCQTDDICKAIGITQRDLSERQDMGPVHRANPKASKPAAPKPAPKPKEEKPERKLVWPPTKVYHYTDEEGRIIFDVLRFTYPEGDKTFRQGIPDANERCGWKLGGVSGLRKPLYRLPEILNGISQGRAIFVVEGEKDADTLYEMGLIGTTNPGGASKPGDKIKWLDEHTQTLVPADVVILPDVDETGLSDRRRVGSELLRAGCKRVKYIDLRRCGVDMPAKGDISDLAKLVGIDRAKEILMGMVDSAAYCTEQDFETDDDLRNRVIDAYMNHAPGYTIEDGCICRWSPDGNKPLCTFMAYPAIALTRDDGINKRGEYLVRCWTGEGKRLDDYSVPYDEFAGRMTWIDKAWPAQVNISTGSTVRDNLRQAMMYASMKLAKKRMMYLHTGWRQIKGRWCYLSQGGAVGAEDVDVQLSGKLSKYTLNDQGSMGITQFDGMIAVSEMKQCMPSRVFAPAIAMVFLAPLRSVLEQAGVAVEHLMYLYGRTGSGKSITASLMLSFFGRFGSNEFPASFSASMGYIRQCAFTLKDSIVVIDDLMPTRNTSTKKNMQMMAESIGKMFGNLDSRDILNSDSTARQSKPPRSLGVVTGELLPDINDSALYRYFCVRMGADDVPKNDRLTQVQRKGTKGYYRSVMRGYIEWLIPQMDTIGERLSERFVEYRARAQHSLSGGHARLPGNVAHMMIGCEMFLRYQMYVLGIDDPQVFASEMEKYWKDVLTNTRDQMDEVGDASPATMFLNSLRELVINGTALVLDLDDIDSLMKQQNRTIVGYKDTKYYYFLPETTYSLVCDVQRKKGLEFPGNQRSMQQRLKEQGMCYADQKGQPLKQKNIGGKNSRYLWIPRVLFDGDVPEKTEQMTMTAVDDGDNPF